MALQLRSGVVESFDDAAGLGAIVTRDGDRYPFHCTEIADGTRTIDVGRAVAFVVTAGGPGRWEAASITEVSGPEA